jgi:cell division septation protein DedD
LQPQGPNPTAAAALGLIPGVGAMYNGQFFKGFIHVVVFVALVSITDRYGLFGIFIGAWVLYQAFEAYHTARAMREGLPIPDPLGLNEVGNWLNLGGRPRGPWQPGTGPAPVNPGPSTSAPAGSTGQSPADPAASGGFQPPHPAGAYGNPWQPQPSYPPYPPTPPCGWRRREPIGAIVLIALGVLFLMGQMNFFSEVMKFAWPLGLIALGVWLIVNQVGNSQGGSK